MKNVEIEIQVNIENSKPLIDLLKKSGQFLGEKHQIDEYFIPKHRDFTKLRPVREWLRLRDAEGKYSINYKNWYVDKEGRSHHCDEYESEINDLEQVKKIFKALDLESIVKVDKKRKTWKYRDYEINLDSVKDLGEFVEIEYVGRDVVGDPKKITDQMVDFIMNLGCGKIKRNYLGYPFQLLFPEEKKYEELR